MVYVLCDHAVIVGGVAHATAAAKTVWMEGHLLVIMAVPILISECQETAALTHRRASGRTVACLESPTGRQSRVGVRRRDRFESRLRLWLII